MLGSWSMLAIGQVGRRSPGRVPEELPLSLRRGLCRSRPVEVDGLSCSTLRQVAAFERSRGWLPGTVRDDLGRWQLIAALPQRRLDEIDERGAGCGIPECCPQPGETRIRLEAVLQHLTGKARRELAGVVGRLEERIGHRLYAYPDVPGGLTA
jgi:hypothetical protein